MPVTRRDVAAVVRGARSGSTFILAVKTRVDARALVKTLACRSEKKLALLGSDQVDFHGNPVTLIKIRVD